MSTFCMTIMSEIEILTSTELQTLFECPIFSTDASFLQDPTLPVSVSPPIFSLVFHDFDTFGIPVSYFVEGHSVWVHLISSYD
jgi:hypothetical protein